MRLIYVLLSPTFGMHQYTADLANRARAGAFSPGQPPDVHLVTTRGYPADRYDPALPVHTPLQAHGTGFSREGVRLAELRRTLNCISELATSADGPAMVHFTGVHLWNAPLVQALRRRGVPVIHTLHDLEAHSGVRFGSLIPRWNGLIIRAGAHILVHAQRYRRQLLDAGVAAERVTVTPLLHGFWAFDAGPDQAPGADMYASELDTSAGQWKNGKGASMLFFGRIEAYKGVGALLAAWSQLAIAGPDARLVIAGAWMAGEKPPPIQPNVELRDRQILDDEAIALFRAADLLVLPYRDATQSALIAAGYAFGLPVIVTDAGALPEYVVPNVTGWVVSPSDSQALASAIQEALGSPAQLRRMGMAGRSWYERQRKAEAETLTQLYDTEAGCPVSQGRRNRT